FVLGGTAIAQTDTVDLQLRRILNAIEVDANAINDAPESLPLETIVQLANEINGYVRQVPALTVGHPTVQRLEIALTEAAGRLRADANSQDRFAAAQDARELLDTVSQLRKALGM